MLKGWLEKVMVQGVGFRLENGRVRPGLGHVRRIVGISTYGSPWWVTKVMNDGGRRTLTRALRMSAGRKAATTWIGSYSIDTGGVADRAAFLDRVEHTMARSAGRTGRGTVVRSLVVYCHPDPDRSWRPPIGSWSTR